MIAAALGKRYERLLFFTAPISLAAMIICLVAIASSTQKERVEARCYENAASVFDGKLAGLTTYWNATPNKDDFWYLDYKLKLETIWIYGSHMGSCYELIDKAIDKEYKSSPADIITRWKSESSKLLKTPLSIYGISLPEDATINLYATKITIGLVLLTQALQVVLLPILLLWLGSLYATRYRESLTTRRAKSLAEVFPHIINMYPAFKPYSPKKRNFLVPYVRPAVCSAFALIRIVLLCVFLAPPVGFYLYSLFMIATEDTAVLYGIAGALVTVFFLTTVLAEFLPSHLLKVFPDPSSGDDF